MTARREWACDKPKRIRIRPRVKPYVAPGKRDAALLRARPNFGKFGIKIEFTPESFWARVDMSGGSDACWPWAAGSSKDYGSVQVDGKACRTHRVAWEVANGRKLTEGEHVLHACDNPPCCNPAHLSAGTHTENMRDAIAKGRWGGTAREHAAKTHCNHGHELTPENIYPSKLPRRQCKICARQRAAAARTRKKTNG